MDEQNRNIIIYQSQDGKAHLQVTLENQTMWLSANQMADLFGRDEKTIRKHINNVFADGELPQENNTHFLSVDGVKQPVAFYSLDMIISVGYRVNSSRATQFRIWATNVLKEYIVKGFAMDDDRLKELGGGNYWKELLDRIRESVLAKR
ncbi:MAG: virulence RhuM family protein [Paludibacteraceae bacterium]|nr:virulence RhuM family protein [Paludibacteraceae bacterium]